MRRILDKVRQFLGILKFQSNPRERFQSQVGGWPVLEGSNWVEKDWLVFD